MYRIRSASGTEAVYNSLEEFHAAVRRGAVAPEDEIFHTRANRWLDVKSHPHYRSAMDWHGGGGGGAPPSAPTPGPRTVVSARPVSMMAEGHPSPKPEPPRPAPPQTVVRPQLVADQPGTRAAAPPPGQRVASPPPPPRKSRELAFINLGEPSQPKTQNVTMIQAQKAPVKVTPAPGTEVEFLIADNGIESPVRNSAGHRAVTEDLELLFDKPLPAGSKPGSSTVVGVPPGREAAPKPTAAAPAVEMPTPPPPPPKVEAPKVEAPKPEAPKVAAPQPPAAPKAAQVEAPPPAKTQAFALRNSDPALEPVKPAPAKPEPPAAAAPAATIAAAPAVATTSPGLGAVKPEASRPDTGSVDLEIPGESILTAPAVATAPVPVAPRWGLPAGLMVGAGVCVLVLGITVAAWKPWSRGATQGSDPTATAPAGGSPSGGTSAGPQVPIVMTRPAGSTPAQRPLPQSAQARAESVVSPPEETVLAAARPTFRTDVDVGAAGLSLGNDLPTSSASVVPPSELARRVTQAEKAALLDLFGKLGGYRGLLAADRIGTAGGAARSRVAWLTGADAIRQYRARIARLEQAYEDSALTSQRAQRWPGEELRAWTARQSLAEPAEVAQLGDLMINQVSEGLELLASLEGQYQIKGDLIGFSSSASVPRYLSIRSWVEQRMGTWMATPENARPQTLSAMLRALGEGFPAVQ